jgi:hypothetical protein
MLYSRVFHLALRLAIAAFVLILLVYCGLRIYMTEIAHRSVALLDEAARIQIGASEDSILPLVARYGGIKWTTPPPIAPIEDCVDKANCAYQNAHRPDYQYGFALSPFKVMPSTPTQARTGRVHHLLTFLMIRTPSEWRDPFSLRDSWTDVEVSIRAGRVVAVSGELYVEGRNRWLGNTWRLSDEMPELEGSGKVYAIDGAFLTFPGNGGAGTVHYLTPRATPEQFKSAHSFSTRCISGLVPCSCLSDLTPLAFQYLGQHPDVGSSIRTEDCPYPSNAR